MVSFLEAAFLNELPPGNHLTDFKLALSFHAAKTGQHNVPATTQSLSPGNSNTGDLGWALGDGLDEPEGAGVPQPQRLVGATRHEAQARGVACKCHSSHPEAGSK